MSKNKVELLRQYKKERIRVAKRITQLTTTIDSLESQLTEEELESSSTDQEQQTILQEMKKEDLVSFLEEN